MATEYEYITVAQLESYAALDYSTIDAAFTNTVIEARISYCERIANDIKRQSYTSAPDDVVAATYLMSMRAMHNLMMEHGYGDEGEMMVQIIDEEILHILDDSTARHDYKLLA